jgi:hypothetical protein
MNDHDVWQNGETRDWRDVVNEIVIEFLIERCIDSIRRSGQEKRIAIGGRTYDRLGGDIATRAGPVVDDKRLAEPLRQPYGWPSRSDSHCPMMRTTISPPAPAGNPMTTRTGRVG